MKILQLGKFYPVKGGVEKVMFDLAFELIKKNISCEVICAGNDKKNNDFMLNKLPIHLAGVIANLFSTKLCPSMVIKLKKISNEFDIIHIHHPDPMATFALYFSNFKGKVILHWHSDIVKQKKMLFFYLPLQKWLLNRSDLIITTSPDYAVQSNNLKLFQNKIKIVPIGINEVNLAQNPEKIKQCYKGKKIIFSLGRLIYYKGFEYLVKAAKYLNDDYVILIGGSGPLEKELKLLIDKENLSLKVILLGRISDNELSNYFAACDVFCLSSIEKSEAFGIVQIEAMAYSKPIIATNIIGSGVPWVNKHNFSGLNVPPRDPKMIAFTIMEICGNSDLYMRLAKGARTRFEELFTIEKMTDNIIEIYNELLCKK